MLNGKTVILEYIFFKQEILRYVNYVLVYGHIKMKHGLREKIF